MTSGRNKGNVFLYIPNLIGYVRVVLMVTSFAIMSNDDPIPPAVIYSLAQLLDALDGTLARYLNQGASTSNRRASLIVASRQIDLTG